ncbi:MAG TPA: hypothetical protein VM260_08970 [Pirellula sp.]|nr:hypothetical protein [Pirellula sp.]
MSKSPNAVYSVGRKLDLASLLVFTAGYALLFALMSAYRLDALYFPMVAGFFTSIGLSQAWLFGGKAPRTASCLAGTLYSVFIALIFLAEFSPSFDKIVLIIVFVSILGLSIGYYSGVCIAGVLLVIDNLRALQLNGNSQIDEQDATCESASEVK